MAKLSQVFDMKFADPNTGVDLLHPPGNRGPPPCFPQRGGKEGSHYEARQGKKSTPYYNNPQNVSNDYRGQFVNAGMNRYEMGVPISLARQLPNYYDVTNGSIDEELEDGLGSNYTRLAAANELNSGMKQWNGQFNSYPEDDGEPKGTINGMKWDYQNSHYVRPSRSTTNPKLFYPRLAQPNVYQLAADLNKQQQYYQSFDDEMVSLGPVMIKKNWLSWILIFILAFFIFDKFLLSFMMMMKSSLSNS